MVEIFVAGDMVVLNEISTVPSAPILEIHTFAVEGANLFL
jgi:hypothetical protein